MGGKDLPSTAAPTGAVTTGPVSLRDLLAHAATRLSKPLAYMIASAHFSFARVLAEDLDTAALESPSFVVAYEQAQRISVSVSLGLRMTRPEVAQSCLLRPSGALLAWLSLQQGEADGGD